MTEVRFKLGTWMERRYKVAISLPELSQQTNNFSVKNRPGCVPKLIGSDPRNLYLHYNVKCNLKDSDPAGHDAKVRFDLHSITDQSSAKNLDVACSCSCPAFLYWGAQWNLNMRDALEGAARPLLTKPTERTDLRDSFVICKHLKTVFERILPSVQRNVNTVVKKKEEDKRKNLQEERKRRRTQRKEEQAESPKGSPAELPVEQTPVPVIERNKPATREEEARNPVLAPGDDGVAEAPKEEFDQDARPGIPTIEEMDFPTPDRPSRTVPVIDKEDQPYLDDLEKREQQRRNRQLLDQSRRTRRPENFSVPTRGNDVNRNRPATTVPATEDRFPPPEKPANAVPGIGTEDKQYLDAIDAAEKQRRTRELLENSRRNRRPPLR